MKIKKEYKELLAINKMLIFSNLYKDERDRIMDYIMTLHNEIKILKEELEDLKNENSGIYKSTDE
jgi:hypothetical protein